MQTVYVLELKANQYINRYFVGSTDNLSHAWEEHKNGNVSIWTRIYKPLRIYQTFHTEHATISVDTIVKHLMRLYGVEQVRGGSYDTLVLTNEQYKNLEQEFFGVQGTCLQCGLSGHFIKQCPRLPLHADSPITIRRNAIWQFTRVAALCIVVGLVVGYRYVLGSWW
jgi:predicted GIY-YIG superfamily endonuclease